MIEETNPSVVIKNFQQNNNRVMTTKKQLQLFGAQFLGLSADGSSALRSLLALLLQLLAEVFPGKLETNVSLNILVCREVTYQLWTISFWTASRAS